MIKMYATSNNGDGHVMEIGQYERVEQIEIHMDMFAKDVVIDFVEDHPKKEGLK